MLNRTTTIGGPRDRTPAGAYQRRGAFRDTALLILAIGAGLVFALSLAVPNANLTLSVTVVTTVVMAVIILFKPVFSVYALVFSAATFESFSLGYPDSLTDQIPVFQGIDNLGIPVPVAVTPVEILMVFSLGVLVWRRMLARQTPLELGPLFPAVGFYSVMVLFGLIHGLGTGGEVNVAIWEARAQTYLLFAYLLAFNLVREESQVRRLTWVFLGALAFKGLVGSYRFLVTLGGDLSRISDFTDYNSLLSHEESFFFALFFALALVLFLFRADRKQLTFGLVAAIPILIAMLANDRRAGVLALILGLAVVFVMGVAILRERRPMLLKAAAVILVAAPIYVLAFGQSEGMVAQPARSVMSVFQPDERDASSNEYREAEAKNLKLNIQDNPVLGKGYGHPLEYEVPLVDLSDLFEMWAYVPHNTILWVWIRLGFVGFVAFWFLIGRSIIQASIEARHTASPYLRAVSVFCVVALVAWIGQGAVDMGLADFRATLLVGTLIAVVARLGQRRKEQAKAHRPSTVSARP